MNRKSRNCLENENENETRKTEMKRKLAIRIYINSKSVSARELNLSHIIKKSQSTVILTQCLLFSEFG